MKRLATFFFALAGLACLALLAYALMRTGHFLQGGADGALRPFAVFYALPAAGAVACFAALRLSAEWRVLLAACLAAALVSAYGAETYLTLATDDLGETASAARDLDYDSRSKLEVVRALRAEGVQAYPYVHPALLLARSEGGAARSVIRIDGAEVLPVGGIGGVVTVVCREAGDYLVYRADRHGFHNPPSAWPPGAWPNPAARARIVAIGDSFAQGHCVPSGHGLVARLREAEPATVSLGAGHDGPLLMLAALREFAARLRPEVLLWLYYEGNDLTIDLPREAASPVLLRYLEPGFEQGLMGMQAAVDAALAAYADGQIVEAAAEEREARRRRLLGIAKLRGLRRMLGGTAAAAPPDLALFERILETARNDVRGWDGQMVFVYLPSWNTMFRPTEALARMRTDVLAIARRLGLPVVDLLPAFAEEPDASTLFFYAGSHYSPQGHALAAREIAEKLEAAKIHQ